MEEYSQSYLRRTKCYGIKDKPDCTLHGDKKPLAEFISAGKPENR